MKPHLLKIENDVFDIVNAIEKVDKNYVVFFNTQKQRFEVHNESQGAVSLSVVLPFEKLDVRSIEHVKKTRVEFVARLVKEMEEQNAKMEKQMQKQILKTNLEKTEDVAKCFHGK